jgi:hypothetical protein
MPLDKKVEWDIDEDLFTIVYQLAVSGFPVVSLQYVACDV